MKTANNTLQQFIIETSIIDPISKIIDQLKTSDFRDCDIKWLDNKLDAFTKLACDTLGFDIILPDHDNGKTLNDYTRAQYLCRFSTLLAYFKTI